MPHRNALVVLIVALAVAILSSPGCQTSKQRGPAMPPGGPPAPPAAPGAPKPLGGPKTDGPANLSGELTVAVPCGVAMAYKAAREEFTKSNPDVRFTETVKNIEPMVREILDGKAWFDVFISLGETEISRLVEAGQVDGESVQFVRHALHLAVQLGNPLNIRSLDDLTKPEVRTVAVPAPELSIGVAGQKALESAGVWDKLVAANKVVRPDQPLKAKNLVIDGKADAAFVYGACSSESWKEGDPELSLAGKADIAVEVPVKLYGGMYGVAVVLKSTRDPELAHKFVDFLQTPQVQNAVVKWGYGKVE